MGNGASTSSSIDGSTGNCDSGENNSAQTFTIISGAHDDCQDTQTQVRALESDSEEHRQCESSPHAGDDAETVNQSDRSDREPDNYNPSPIVGAGVENVKASCGNTTWSRVVSMFKRNRSDSSEITEEYVKPEDGSSEMTEENLKPCRSCESKSKDVQHLQRESCDYQSKYKQKCKEVQRLQKDFDEYKRKCDKKLELLDKDKKTSVRKLEAKCQNLEKEKTQCIADYERTLSQLMKVRRDNCGERDVDDSADRDKKQCAFEFETMFGTSTSLEMVEYLNSFLDPEQHISRKQARILLEEIFEVSYASCKEAVLNTMFMDLFVVQVDRAANKKVSELSSSYVKAVSCHDFQSEQYIEKIIPKVVGAISSLSTMLEKEASLTKASPELPSGEDYDDCNDDDAIVYGKGGESYRFQMCSDDSRSKQPSTCLKAFVHNSVKLAMKMITLGSPMIIDKPNKLTIADKESVGINTGEQDSTQTSECLHHIIYTGEKLLPAHEHDLVYYRPVLYHDFFGKVKCMAHVAIDEKRQ